MFRSDQCVCTVTRCHRTMSMLYGRRRQFSSWLLSSVDVLRCRPIYLVARIHPLQTQAVYSPACLAGDGTDVTQGCSIVAAGTRDKQPAYFVCCVTKVRVQHLKPSFSARLLFYYSSFNTSTGDSAHAKNYGRRVQCAQHYVPIRYIQQSPRVRHSRRYDIALLGYIS